MNVIKKLIVWQLYLWVYPDYVVSSNVSKRNTFDLGEKNIFQTLCQSFSQHCQSTKKVYDCYTDEYSQVLCYVETARQKFEVDLDGAQTLRVLCYSQQNAVDSLLGKGAIEVFIRWQKWVW